MTRRLIDIARYAVVITVIGALAWYIYGQSPETGKPAAQQQLAGQVPQSAATVHPKVPQAQPVAIGEALATMRIPRFGADWKWTALEGVADDVIANGPGHYEGTALPGERGNAAFAAHRAGHGDPFIDFDLLRPGDRVLVSQGRTTWTYTITMTPRIIDIDDVWVLDRLRGRMLTLTTCWPKYGSARRMFVRARLTGVTPAPA